MGSEIATKTLSGPLPGGSEGAVVTVRPLLTGEMRSPGGFLYRPHDLRGRLRLVREALTGRRNVWLPIPAFLVEHPTAGHMLIDTGLGASVALDPKTSVGRFGALIFTFRMEPKQALVAQLRELELAPSDIKTVVMTHMHNDHTGAISDFPDPVYVVSSREWKAATAPRGFPRGYIKRHFMHAFDYRLVDFDDNAVNSFASFGRSFDLFGDGSVVLVYTPGHAAGHQSVILRTRAGEVLVCGDAAYSKRTLDESLVPLITHDDHNFRRSLREIQSYIDMTPGTTAIPGHDPDNWSKVAEAY